MMVEGLRSWAVVLCRGCSDTQTVVLWRECLAARVGDSSTVMGGVETMVGGGRGHGMMVEGSGS